jgi:hypothetical protein
MLRFDIVPVALHRGSGHQTPLFGGRGLPNIRKRTDVTDTERLHDIEQKFATGTTCRIMRMRSATWPGCWTD